MRLIHGSAHDIPIPAGSVQMIVTSPPYWGLRAYAGEQGIEWPAVAYAPMPGLPELRIAGCEPGCDHEWADRVGGEGYADGVRRKWQHGTTREDMPEAREKNMLQGAYCRKCGGWRGGLGLEPTPEMYIAHLILCLREWRRVLRDDGVAFCNLGDSYYGGKGQNGSSKARNTAEERGYKQSGGTVLMDTRPLDMPQAGLKPKDLCGIPWRFAFAAQADGWWLRSDVIWAKPNPMPESVTDRPTRSHEYVFLLAKSQRYYWDADAVREEHKPESIQRMKMPLGALRDRFDSADLKTGNFDNYLQRDTGWGNPAGRNLRSVWAIPTQPTPFAHFATYPEKLVEPCIRAGSSERGCCATCGAPWVRVTDAPEEYKAIKARNAGWTGPDATGAMARQRPEGKYCGSSQAFTVGWRPGCACGVGEPVPCTILDPFHGSGTTGKVAVRLGREYIGVDVSEDYLGAVTDARFANGVQIEMAL